MKFNHLRVGLPKGRQGARASYYDGKVLRRAQRRAVSGNRWSKGIRRRLGHPRASSKVLIEVQRPRHRRRASIPRQPPRARSVGEMAEERVPQHRSVHERARGQEAPVAGEPTADAAGPHQRQVAAAVRKFFGSSQLQPVHGPEQSAVGSHAQAPRVRWVRAA